MTKQTKYKHVLENAIEHIEKNIFSPLSTASIAKEVGFSEYHFQRIFTATIGESAADYVRKRRLSEAAYKLSRSTRSISEIAHNCQFGSQEAFTRAFSKMFGLTPGQFRSSRKRDQLLLMPKANLSMILSMRQGTTLSPVIVERQSEYAVGMAGSFFFKSLFPIHELWNQFLERLSEIKHVKPGYELGVCSLTHPLFEKQEGHDFVYSAALPVTAFDDIPAGMVPCELRAGRYAMFTYKGRLCDFQHTIDYILFLSTENGATVLAENGATRVVEQCK